MNQVSNQILPRRFLTAVAVGFGLWLALGVGLNPIFSDQRQIDNAVLASESIVALLVTTVAFVRASRFFPVPSPPVFETSGAFSWRSVILAAIIFAAAIFLHRDEWAKPRAGHYNDDDRMNMADAATWKSTRDHLFKPFNEHLLVPTRLWAFAAVQLSTAQTLPYWLLNSIWAFYGIALVQLFALARREFGGDAAGVLAVAAFGLTFSYHECLWWFMAGQWLWTLNLLLLVWLILDPARPSAIRANVAAALAFLGPFMFSIGLVVGPCAAMWIFCRWPRHRGHWWRPIAGGLLGLVATAPFIINGLRRDEHGRYNPMVKWFEFNLWRGLAATPRQMVDYLGFVNFGITRGSIVDSVPSSFDLLGVMVVPLATLIAQILFPIMIAVPLVILVKRQSCWRLAPFVLLIVLNYGLVAPFRSWMDYSDLASWLARYQMFAHLGLVLFLVGACAEFGWTTRKHSLAWAIVASVIWFIYQEMMHHRLPAPL